MTGFFRSVLLAHACSARLSYQSGLPEGLVLLQPSCSVGCAHSKRLQCLLLPQVIAANTADAETKQKNAQQKEEALKVESANIEVEKREAEQALSEAIPALEDAAAALNDLKRDDITELKSFSNPPKLVQRVSKMNGALGLINCWRNPALSTITPVMTCLPDYTVWNGVL